MGLEILKHYEGAARKQAQYSHIVRTKIPSIGQRKGCRIPDLLLTMQYNVDAHGNIMREPLLTFQVDDITLAELNFRHHTLKFKHVHSVCRFEVQMDAVFGEGVVVKENSTATIGGTAALNKIVSTEVQGTSENGTERPGARTLMHGLMSGMLTHKENRLDAWGELI